MTDQTADTSEATHRPCCSAHGVDMTCAKYRRTHFVEVGACCPAYEADALCMCGHRWIVHLPLVGARGACTTCTGVCLGYVAAGRP